MFIDFKINIQDNTFKKNLHKNTLEVSIFGFSRHLESAARLRSGRVREDRCITVYS